MYKILFLLSFLCVNTAAFENCISTETDKKFDTKLVSSLAEEEKCQVKGTPIESGLCITSFYTRLPKPSVSSYLIDLKNGIAIYSEGKSLQKTIKLSKKQLNEIECLAYAVWAHKNLYPEEKRKFEEEFGEAPKMLLHADNDLLSFSFHYSQHLTLVAGANAKVIGGESVAFINEANALYNYVAGLSSK